MQITLMMIVGLKPDSTGNLTVRFLQANLNKEADGINLPNNGNLNLTHCRAET